VVLAVAQTAYVARTQVGSCSYRTLQVSASSSVFRRLPAGMARVGPREARREQAGVHVGWRRAAGLVVRAEGGVSACHGVVGLWVAAAQVSKSLRGEQCKRTSFIPSSPLPSLPSTLDVCSIIFLR